MKVWLITVGEPLPTDGQGDRLLRTASFAELLTQKGHDVLWWTSDFDHVRKRHRSRRNDRIEVADRYQIQTLSSIGYRHNISIRRIVDQIGVARQFRKLAVREHTPDVILCSLPTLELCEAAIQYGRARGIPVVLDMRDLWPDLFLDILPSRAQVLGRAILSPMFRQVRKVCREATAIVGITDEFVSWGLNHGGRSQTSWDQTFSMAYRETAPAENDLARAREFWRQQGLAEKHFVACFFGVMGRHSEIETVISAVRKIESNTPNLRAVLCGVGPNFDRCRRAAEGSSSLILPGWINAAQIWTLSRMSRVGLAPFVNCENYTRNMPNKPVEYLSAGLPIVTSLQGVLSKVLTTHDCGVVYPEGDSAALAKVLLHLQANATEVDRMSANAKQVYNDKYRASVVYPRFEAYLRNLVQFHSQSQRRAA